MIKMYGVFDKNDCLIDVSKSEQGAKNYATRHNYTKIGYRVGYIAIQTHEKIGNKWKQSS